MTFAAGQRSEIGRYKDHWEVSFPGLGIRMINEINEGYRSMDEDK